MSRRAPVPNLSLAALFLVFFKIGTFALGGSYSMINLFERELVERRGWLRPQEFPETLAIGEMAPGSPIINMGIAAGYKLRGLSGGIMATLGQALTGTVLAIVLAAFYLQGREHTLLQAVMKGAAAATVGLLAAVAYKMGRQLIRGWSAALFCAGAFVALALFGLNPVLVMLAAGLLGVAVHLKGAR